MAARGRGRPQVLSDDPTTDDTPDPGIRLGWLLAVSRRAHPAYADGAAFVAALADAGAAVSRSTVSRWESGALAPSPTALAAYESVLSLPQGTLVGPSVTLQPTRVQLARGELRDRPRDVEAALDHLLDRAEAGTATSYEWWDLGRHLVVTGHVHLRPASWQLVARHLVRKLAVRGGTDELLLNDAGGSLGVLPRGRDAILSAVHDLVETDGSQLLMGPFELLAELPGEVVATQLIDWFERLERPNLAHATTAVVTRRLVEGTFSEDERSRIALQVLRVWRSRPQMVAELLAGLVQELPGGLREALRRAAEDSEHGAPFAAVQTPLHGGREADAVVAELESGLGDHEAGPLLARLMTEMLYHRHAFRRDRATMLVAASPFRSAVASGLIGLLERHEVGRSHTLPAGWALGRLSGPEHRMRLHRVAEGADVYLTSLIHVALGQLPFDQVTDHVLRQRLDEPLPPPGGGSGDSDYGARTALLALGRTRSPALRGISRGARLAWQRESAAWWVNTADW